MSRAATVLVLLPCLLWGCGRRSEERKAEAGADAAEGGERDGAAAEPAPKLPTALPDARPAPFEAEYHVGTPDSDDLVSAKVSDAGASVSLGDREHRVVLTYDVRAEQLDRAYAALRAAAFDRIETAPSREVRPGGTSIRLVAGKVRKSVADFGRVYPEDAWAAEYDAAARALEDLLPSPPKGAVVTFEVRWDASMKGHRAAVALALGPDFAGATKTGTGGDVRVGLAKARAVTVTLRSGPPARSTDLQLDPSLHAAIVVAFDPETSMPVATPISREADGAAGTP